MGEDQVDYALEATSSAFVPVARLLEHYNQIVADGCGSNFDQEGLGATHKAGLYSVLYDSEIWTLDANYFARPEVKIGAQAGFVRRALVNLSDDPSAFRGVIYLFGESHRFDMPLLTRDIGRQLAPHLAKAVELNRIATELRRRYDAALSVLDKIDTGIFVLHKTGEVMLRNRAANDILDQLDGLTLARNKSIKCSSVDDTSALSGEIDRASKTARGEGKDTQKLLQIRRRASEIPLVAVVSPLRDAEMELEKGLEGALLTVIDPCRPIHLQTEVLARAYGLTKAEARVATFLVRGYTNKEIAERVTVSAETIKSQVSAIFAKCGVMNRASFFWRVFQFSPPIL